MNATFRFLHHTPVTVEPIAQAQVSRIMLDLWKGSVSQTAVECKAPRCMGTDAPGDFVPGIQSVVRPVGRAADWIWTPNR